MSHLSTAARIAGTVLAAAILLQPVARAQAPSQPSHGHTAASSGAGAGMDMMASMKDMHSKMGSMPMTGDHDVDFAMMMRVHHQGAIHMAQAELSNGKDAGMKKMARKIITDQQKEIAQLDRFLAGKGHAAHKK